MLRRWKGIGTSALAGAALAASAGSALAEPPTAPIILRCLDLPAAEGGKANIWEVENNRLVLNGTSIPLAGVTITQLFVSWSYGTSVSILDRTTGEMTVKSTEHPKPAPVLVGQDRPQEPKPVTRVTKATCEKVSNGELAKRKID